MDKIYKYFTLNLPVTVPYINWFTNNFPVSEFSGIDAVLYLFLEYCSKLGVIAKREYLLIFLSTELKRLVRKYNIRVEALTANFNYEEIAAFEQAVIVISNATIDTYDKFCLNEIDDASSFKVLLSEFMHHNMKERLTRTFSEQYARVSKSEDIIDVAANTKVELSRIQSIYDTSRIAKLDFLIGDTTNKPSSGEAELISKTGLPAIDEDYGGLYSKALVTFAGQPGYGKTRFLLAVFIYPALVHYKVGVRMDELELAEYEVNNILLSIHIANLYKIKIPDRDINRGDLTEEQRKIVESARIDLFESGKYGRFRLSTEQLYVENMYEEASNFFKVNRDILIWAVDYIGRIVSRPETKYDKKMPWEIIDKALMIGKDVAKLTNICSVFVNQYNEDGNKAADIGRPIIAGMIQGGQSIQRHSDFDVAITATQDQNAAKLRMMSTTKARAANGFTFVPLQTDLAISRFTQISKLDERG